MVDNSDLGNPRTQALLLMIGIAVVTLVAVWAVPRFTDETQGPVEHAGLTLPNRSEPIQPLPRFTAPGSHARARIEEFRAAGTPAEDAFKEGARQLARGRSIDAYLLYFHAARQGHTDAALALATQADPAYHDPILGFIDRPNVTQAIKWYRVAANAGDITAQDRLDSLQNRIDQEAALGSEEAQRLTLLWR